MSRSAHRIAHVPLFVYGTLLRGEDNHALLRECRFAGDARTEPCFTLIDLGPYPVMVRRGTTSVVGELYWVPLETLTALDRFEGHPHLYERSRIRLAADPHVGPAAPAWAEAYLAPKGVPTGTLVASGDWRLRARRVEPA
jgi:gamma-glutamylcyclotransferase (GGCT)/AIG2-like uncharacterized protein YtfP